jgi:pimeloyl-ACP methyl ester carboxylesterase
MTYSERVISVGAPTPLAGMFTAPERASTKSPALILLNSGLMHRVGTCNLSVKLARSVAGGGISAFRFDFSGIGDSRTRTFAGSHEAREVSEVREVMDVLVRQEGITQFVLCGLCSGADAALATAAVDPRVVGIVQFDPLCFRTPMWHFYHYYSRILDINRWFRLLKRLSGMQTSSEGLSPDFLVENDELAGHDFDRQSITSAYEGLVSRGVRILVVMTSAQEDTYNSLGQLREAFSNIDFGSTLEEYYLPETQHIFAEPEDQELIVDLVSRWAASTT